MPRADHTGTHRTQYEKNKKIILRTQSVCKICGNQIDMTLKFPHPMSPTVDHIIPISKGGHPSSMDNLQLAHFICNRMKSDKTETKKIISNQVISNRDLPWSIDWNNYHA